MRSYMNGRVSSGQAPIIIIVVETKIYGPCWIHTHNPHFNILNVCHLTRPQAAFCYNPVASQWTSFSESVSSLLSVHKAVFLVLT